MATDKQIAANRLNAQKSTGPKTPEGKSISSRNAIKHGFLAQSVLLPGESNDRFLLLKNRYIADFQPKVQKEFDLIDTLAVNRWRIMRNWTYETIALVLEQRRQSPQNGHEDLPTQAWLARQSTSHEALSRYESRLDRHYYKALDRLHAYQSERERKEMLKQTQNNEQKKDLTDFKEPNPTTQITQSDHPENPIQTQ